MKRLLQANALAGKIKKHYENYPETPEGLKEWAVNAEGLWKQKKLAVKQLSSVSIEYH